MDPSAKASDPLKMASSTYSHGLREVFPACHEPLPPKFEEMARRLDVAFEKAHSFQERGVIDAWVRRFQ
jgi:hypothetical protein